jgi:GST-like protein
VHAHDEPFAAFLLSPDAKPLQSGLISGGNGPFLPAVPHRHLAGDQHSAEFRALNPNGKVPVVVDEGIVIFDSSAILLHLAQKTGRFLGGSSVRTQAELLSC